jgi:hypothetical protein
MTELSPMYGYIVLKKYHDNYFDSQFDVMFGHNAIEVYIDALNLDIVLVHIQMRAHD